MKYIWNCGLQNSSHFIQPSKYHMYKTANIVPADTLVARVPSGAFH